MKKINGYFKKPYLHGLTFEAIDRWQGHHGSHVNPILSDIKKISILLHSWSDKSKVVFSEDLKFDTIEREIKNIIDSPGQAS